ncbi:MAG TPA: transposase, partial [Methylocystis sp.]
MSASRSNAPRADAISGRKLGASESETVRARLAYKPEHAVDFDTGVIVAASIHEADQGDTATLDPTLEEAEKNLSAVGLAPRPEEPCDLVADEGYHSRDVLKGLDNGPWKTRISEPRPSKGYSRWHGDDEAREAVYGNRNRLKSGVGKEAMRKRGEIVERSFAHVLGRGGMRRTWLRGRENVHKRYLVHVAGYNLGILMRAVRRRHAEGGRQRQICVPVHHSGRRYDRLRDPPRVRRADSG